jgi:hypothetical protein
MDLMGTKSGFDGQRIYIQPAQYVGQTGNRLYISMSNSQGCLTTMVPDENDFFMRIKQCHFYHPWEWLSSPTYKFMVTG